MGYDLHRFQEEVDEELICPICSGVLEEPLQTAMCEHAFCRVCINEWLSRQPTCPIDRNSVTAADLRAVPRILRNLLSRLSIICENAEYGCKLVVKLDILNSHLEECKYNPKRPLTCEKDLTIPKDEQEGQNGSREMSTMIPTRERRLFELRRKFQLLYWGNRLERARVTRWDVMIPMPDDELLMSVKRALFETGCLPHILENLMENCHERRWPQGLSSVEARQNNRQIFGNYICRRIPGTQAVLVMSRENTHMPQEVMVDPGLVLIFSHGVE